MKTTVIQLEPHDDLNSARDKMSWCRSGRILLVYPEAARILDHKLDLKLLYRFSQTLGAQMAVVSDDPEVQINAKDLRIPVFSTEATAQKSPWRRLHFRWKLMERKDAPRVMEAQGKAQSAVAAIWQRPKLRIAIFVVSLLAVFGLAWIFIPSAQVIVPEVKKEQSLKLPVRASTTLVGVNPSGAFPALVDNLIVEAQGQAASSGIILVPDKPASVNVKFTNLTSFIQTVPQGTIILTFRSQPTRFKMLQSVTVPAGPGQTALSSAQAVVPGSTGNVAAGTIDAFEGSLGLKLVVTNPEAAQGGTDRAAHSPTQTDYIDLEKKVNQQLIETALQEIQAKLAPGEKIIPGSLKLLSVLQNKRDPEVGQPSESSTLTLRAEFRAWHFRTKDLLQVAEIALNANLEPGMVEIVGSLACNDLDQPQIQNNEARWDIQASRQTERVWDKGKIISIVAGQRPDYARQDLKENLGLTDSPQIIVQPAWWPFLPMLPFRIDVRMQ